MVQVKTWIQLSVLKLLLWIPLWLEKLGLLQGGRSTRWRCVERRSSCRLGYELGWFGVCWDGMIVGCLEALVLNSCQGWWQFVDVGFCTTWRRGWRTCVFPLRKATEVPWSWRKHFRGGGICGAQIWLHDAGRFQSWRYLFGWRDSKWCCSTPGEDAQGRYN